MAAVASEPEAAVPTITTTTAATDDGGPAEPGPVGPGHSEPDGPAEFGPCRKLEDHEEGRHDRPESEPEAGRGPDSGLLLDRTDRMDRVSPDSRGSYRTILPDPQHSAVFLHSLPDPPPGTEAGLSLAEPAEPTTNGTTDRAEAAEPDRVYLGLMQADLGPGPADGTAERPEPGTGCREEPAVQVLLDPSSNPTGPEPTSVLDLSPGSEVRVCLDHVIDDALVVSFRVGEQVFSGVLMDVSKRFGPYGIPITTVPHRDERSQPPASLLPVSVDTETSTKQEDVSSAPRSLTPSQPWSSRPPPLFQEGAPYPPPLFIRDTYNQALPQPPPRKIKRPKRRYRCEEPTSIMNAIKLRPRQVLCDKCKGVVSGGYREARRGPVQLRSHEVLGRRRAADLPISTELKRLRGDDRGGRSAPDRRSSSGMPVSSSSSSSSSSRRILRGVASSTASSSQEHSKLNSKKVLAKSSAADRSKSQQVLQKLVPHHLPAHQDKNQNRSKAVTRAVSLQNQKVHFTRRLQHLSSAAGSAHTPLPPRMRLKPQRTLKSC
ncbi:PWWP domain-containing protein 2A [Austrofundulus limnaeus]|uniref:PWWP domain-containing protein 2A n=1 Tax=Austrofundulus limnaeus TaxID=52670 RepID=A0A2I4CVV5_AUSLI|nr:PREDICTED: PWWP domain-containing protein 2A-like [Austrofundulus limnaeus]